MFRKYLTIMSLFTISFYSLYSQADNIFSSFFGKKPGVAPVEDLLYLEECGVCHFPYQPGLLPAKSWEKMMNNLSLENHFGEDIVFDEQRIRKQLLNYMIVNAADNSSFKRSRKIMKSLSYNDAPLSILKTPYIRRKHSDIPQRLIIQPEVGTLSNCEACHKKASKGNYDDDQVRIPNSKLRYDDGD